jgi:hypothetical protein
MSSIGIAIGVAFEATPTVKGVTTFALEATPAVNLMVVSAFDATSAFNVAFASPPREAILMGQPDML